MALIQMEIFLFWKKVYAKFITPIIELHSFYTFLYSLLFFFTMGIDISYSASPLKLDIQMNSQTMGSGSIVVTDFFPREYVTDGSVSYQVEIQKAIDTASRKGSTLVFPPMIYRIDESGFKIFSHMSFLMYGAVFEFDQNCDNDGQAFLGHNVENVRFFGGEIVGHNNIWPEGINIRGIYLTGNSQNIRMTDISMQGLSSNGIGIFGETEYPIKNVWVRDVVIKNSSNFYGDYLSANAGPEKGSVRQDQGLIAFYYVHDFIVQGCHFEKSRSDGTHFYKCKRGQFMGNKVYAAQMGGYFLETCEDVLASDNIIQDNGSRGVTIERGSINCTLMGCFIANSGREGLWAPDCIGLIIDGNIFNRNGRKPNGALSNQIWNANITINEASHDPSNSPTQDYIISNNIIYTENDQVAAIRINADTAKWIIVKNNLLNGDNQHILIEGEENFTILVEDNK